MDSTIMRKEVFGCILPFLFILLSCDYSKEIEFYPVLTGKYWQYVDSEGKTVLAPRYLSAALFSDGLALVSVEDKGEAKYGYIDKSGNFIIQPIYSQATIFNEGLAWVVQPGGVPEAIDKKGETRFSLPEIYSVSAFFDGLALVSVIGDQGQPSFGYINNEGQMSVKPYYSDADIFSGHLAAVRTEEGKWGFIDRSGKLEIPAVLDKSYDGGDYNNPFESGSLKFGANRMAIAQENGLCGLIGSDGSFRVSPRFTAMSADGDRYIICQNGKWGWCDEKGKVIIEPDFEAARPFNNGKLAPVMKNGKWGYISRSGKTEIEPVFEDALSFTGKTALVKKGGKYGFIDRDGDLVSSAAYQAVGEDVYNFVYGNSTFLYVQNERLALLKPQVSIGDDECFPEERP